MSEKKKPEIPLIFIVTRFLYSGMKIARSLTPNECRLLLFLADCFGTKGIIPGRDHISFALNISPSTIKRTTLLLEEKNLLIVDRKQGFTHAYGLVIPCPNCPDKLSTTPINYDRTKLSTTRVTHDCPPRSNETGTQVTHDLLYNLDPLEDKPRGGKVAKKAAPLSPLSAFLPSKENVHLAERYGLVLEEQIISFKKRWSGKGTDLQFEFERWLKNGFDFSQRKKSNVININSQGRCAVPDFVKPAAVNKAPMPEALRDLVKKIKY